MREKLVSICLLVYNHEKYIDDCLESLMNQTYPNIELLIIDDASKDNSCAKIHMKMNKMESIFLRVLFIENRVNVGIISSNVNILIKEAKGEYIKGFAGDDIMHSACIEKLVEHLENNKNEILCYSNMYIVDDRYPQGDVIPRTTCFKNHRPLKGEKLFRSLMKGNFIPAPTTLIRKSAYEKYGLHDEKMRYEDYDFFLRLSRKEEFGYVSKNLVFYRRANGSICNVRKWKDKNKIIISISEKSKIMKKYLKYVGKKERKRYICEFYLDYIWRAYTGGYYDIVIVLAYKALRKGVIDMRDIIHLIKK